MTDWIDLRSDTVTKPSVGMRKAMAEAEVGDDVYGDDPTVIALERRLAEITGKDQGLFLPSGTQSNLVALMSHCERGDEYIVGQSAHTYRYEGGGAAVLASIQPQPLANEEDGTLSLSAIEGAIKPDDIHFARTRLIALENTIGGRVLPRGYANDVKKIAMRAGLRLHLDGARVFNAAVAQHCSVMSLCEPFDSVSVCLSKGLGTPAGSVLCGPPDFIKRGRRWRKMLGGGMRQAGILAAAGLYAVEHNVARLEQDHANASKLAEGLAKLQAFGGTVAHTNMVFVNLLPEQLARLQAEALVRRVRITISPRTRMVTHLDVDAVGIDRVVDLFAAVL